MREKQDIINTWPRTRSGQVILVSSLEAISYAQLLPHNTKAIHEIKTNREAVRTELKQRRQRVDVDYNRLMTLACRSAFYRQCLDELDRITNEKSNLEDKLPWEENHQNKNNKDA